jgi:hypothetical protein
VESARSPACEYADQPRYTYKQVERDREKRNDCVSVLVIGSYYTSGRKATCNPEKLSLRTFANAQGYLLVREMC